ECERRDDRLRPCGDLLRFLLCERVRHSGVVGMFLATASAAGKLRSCLSGRLHPASASGPGLQGHPLPETSASSRRILIISTGTAMGSAVRLRGCLGAAPSLGFFRQGRATCLARKNLHGLDVYHLKQAVPAQLAADAAVLDSAEGHPRIRFRRPVDEDEARLDLAD